MIPSLETAVNLLMDGRPVIGENVVVFGQGIVGLLSVGLLSDFPLATLVAVDPSAPRRAMSKRLGADAVVSSLTPSTESTGPTAPSNDMFQLDPEGADLAYELTGQPSVLNDAIRHTAFDGRIVVGSWYGSKRAPIDLGGRFHRSRMEIISSQVSTIDPSYRGRWTKERRMGVVLDCLDEVKPGRLISDRFDLEEAPTVHEHLAGDPSMLQPIFVYD
ncbi:MAG: zinc-binding alcohol dehydrogenase [Salinibacter sp.]